MKNIEVEIENRVKEIKDGKRDFFMVDLIVDGEKIDTGENPIRSHSFWRDMEDQSQRAIHRIEKNNPTMSFDFNLSTMGMTDEQIEQRFRNHIKNNHPDFDGVDRLFDLVDAEVGEIQVTGPDDNHPNPFLKFQIGSQMTKNFILCVVEKFLKDGEDSI